MSAETLRESFPKRVVYEHDAAMERAKIAFLAARTPYARRKALRKLEELRDRSTSGLRRTRN